MQKSTRFKLAIFVVVVASLASIFTTYLLDKRVKFKKNFWRDGINVGRPLKQAELESFEIFKSGIKSFKNSLSSEEIEIFEYMLGKFNSRVSRKPQEYMNYKKMFKSKEEKDMIYKILRWRREFIKSLPSGVYRKFKSGIKKVTLQQKIEITGGLIIL